MQEKNMGHICPIGRSGVNGILHRLEYIYPQTILITLYKSLFVPHINYGSLIWGHAGGALDKIQKRLLEL